MRRAVVSSAFLVVAFLQPGCLFAKFTARNMAAMSQPQVKVPNKIREPRRDDARLAVLWVGHSTVLIQMDDEFILTDPVFTDSVAQVHPRIVEAGLDAADLPDLDAVLISHLHFDHLSLGSIERIESNVRWLGIPPPGLRYLTNFNFRAEHLPWWRSKTLPSRLKITSVPVRHNGWRFGLDKAWMKTSYTGYVIEHAGMTVYFAGDTAYDKSKFTAVANRFPELDLALIPIAPIHPRDFMHHTHLDPAEALDAFEDLRAKRMMPIHFDTFVNSLDEPGEAKRVLDAEIQKRGIDPSRIVRLKIGEQRVVIGRATR